MLEKRGFLGARREIVAREPEKSGGAIPSARVEEPDEQSVYFPPRPEPTEPVAAPALAAEVRAAAPAPAEEPLPGSPAEEPLGSPASPVKPQPSLTEDDRRQETEAFYARAKASDDAEAESMRAAATVATAGTARSGVACPRRASRSMSLDGNGPLDARRGGDDHSVARREWSPRRAARRQSL